GERADAVRRDYGRTLTELFEDRFLKPMREWAQQKGVRFRIQNYGVPPAALASARYADTVDGEGFEWRTLSTSRWASSAAHLLGKSIVSSEGWTWLHSPAFRATPLDLKAEADRHFLSGINQLIGHGWPYSPPQAGTPGWMFYAAGVYSDKNPWWPVMADTSRYLQRVSAVLRQGEPFADVALFAPTEDVWAQFRPGNPRALNLASGIRDAIGPTLVPAILDAGHNFDLADSRTLHEALQRKYRFLVMPPMKSRPDPVDRYVAGGGQVLPGSGNDLAERLSVMADVRFVPPSSSIGFVHRRLRDGDVYFLANTGNRPVTVEAMFSAGSTLFGFPRGPNKLTRSERWDPLTGAIEPLPQGGSSVPLSFEPYGSQMVVFRTDDAGEESRPTSRRAIESIALGSGWKVSVNGKSTENVSVP